MSTFPDDRVYITHLTRESASEEPGPLYWHAHRESARTSNPPGVLQEEAEADNPDEMVEWGRQRCPWVLISGTDGVLYWAGSGPRPDDITNDWADAPWAARGE